MQRLLVAAILSLSLLTATSVVAVAQEEPTTPSAPPAASPSPITWPVVERWPGGEHVPAGVYAYLVGGRSRWMHKVPGGWSDDAPNSVELTFVSAEPRSRPISVGFDPLWRSWYGHDPITDGPVRTLQYVRQVWLMDVDETRVAILLDSYPDTDPSLVAEAVAVVESITVHPTVDGSGRLLAFELPPGWDSG